jgi:HEXXH motif-containing protein
MRARHHHIPPSVLAALAAGHGGSEAIQRLVSLQYSRHVLLVRGVVDAVTGAGAGEMRAAFDLLADIQQQAPSAVDRVIRHPAVGAWALSVLNGEANPAALGGVTAAAAVRARVPCTVNVPVEHGRVMLPSVGQATFSPSCTSAEVQIGRAEIRAEIWAGGERVVIPADAHRDAPGWRGLRRLTACDGSPLHLLLDDLDPHRFPAARVRRRLSDDEAARWEAILRDAWSLLRRHHWTTAAEIRGAIRVLTPLEATTPGLRSATHPHAFGAAGLSDPVDGLSLACTLAHEVQHAKLAALMNAILLVFHGDSRTFYAPWRDDPRPLGGLLQGAYAYLGVSGFWRRQRHHERGETAVAAHTEFALWRDAVLEATHTLLDSGGLTQNGETFVTGMRRTLLAWRSEPVLDVAVSLARRSAERHRANWRRRNGREI